MAKKPVIKFTANFERNLEEIERFVTDAEAPQAYDALLDKLLETVVPNLERFPGMGGPFILDSSVSPFRQPEREGPRRLGSGFSVWREGFW